MPTDPSASPRTTAPPKLGILAGSGPLPRRLVETCVAAGRPFFVLAFDGETEPATVAGTDHAWVRVGAVAPGMIETPMTQGMNQKARDALVANIPVGRIGVPEVIELWRDTFGT
mgnify:CR=1 FL=1